MKALAEVLQADRRAYAVFAVVAVALFSLSSFAVGLAPNIYAIIAFSLFLLSLGLRDIGIPDTAWLTIVMMITGIGLGIGAPAANNAALDVVPGKISSISGIRGVFRTVGGIVGASSVVMVLSRFSDKGEGLELVFLVLSVIVFLSNILVFFIPDMAKRRYTEGKKPAGAQSPS